MRSYGWLLVAAILVASTIVSMVVFNRIPTEESGVQGALDSLRTELDSTKAAVRAYQANHDSTMTWLMRRLEEENGKRLELERRVSRMVVQDPLEWLRSLPASERDRIVSHINGKIAEEL